MLTLNKQAPIVRYAFWMSDKYNESGPPDAVSLCELFWRCVPPSLALTGVTALIAGAVYGIREALLHPGPTRPPEPVPWYIGAAVVAFVLFVVLAWWIDHYPEGWIAAIYRALKGTFCPRITLAGVTEWQKAEAAKLQQKQAREQLLLAARERVAVDYLDAAIDDDGDLVVMLEEGRDLALETQTVAAFLREHYAAPWCVWGNYDLVAGARIFAELTEPDAELAGGAA